MNPGDFCNARPPPNDDVKIVVVLNNMGFNNATRIGD
jgi:hypothetical protein